MKNLTFTTTKRASYVGYVVQASVNNLSPLLFATFNDGFHISLGKLSIIILVNFITQTLIDITSTLYVDRIGYRASTVIAHVLSALGFISLGILPYVISPFAGIMISTVLLASGGGLIEVIISPLVDAIPSDNKASGMAFLHSFYCWGQMLTIGVSTLLFLLMGIERWHYVSFLWAIIPAVNAVIFCMTPFPDAERRSSEKRSRGLISPIFFALIVLMVCSGACELAMSQWASFYLETALGIDKTVGDLLGPCAFAALMGVGRVLAATVFKNVRGENLMLSMSCLSVISYLTVALSPSPMLSLIGCALCGLAVSSMWPSTYSMGSAHFPLGGTVMFALFAFFGDTGCTVGPQVVSLAQGLVDIPLIQSIFSHTGAGRTELGMRAGFLLMCIFPLLAIFSCIFIKLKSQKKKDTENIH